MSDKPLSEEVLHTSLFKGLIFEEYAKNPDFAEAIKEDPKKAISELFPDDDLSEVSFETVIEKPGTVVIPLPDIPEELTVEQLEAVAGGAIFGGALAKVATLKTAKLVGGGIVGGAVAANQISGIIKYHE